MSKKERAVKELARARKSLLAAKILLQKELFEDCVSRAYYAVLHAAKASLFSSEIEVNTHDGVRSMFSLHLVKNGKIEKEFAKILTAEHEDREIGDYEIEIPIEEERARQRVKKLKSLSEELSNIY